MEGIPSASVSLTRKQRRAIPLILAEKSIEAGCRSAGIAKQTFYNWLMDETFRGEYQRQQGQLFDLAFDTMKRNVQDGADKLAGLLETDNPLLLRRVCRDVLDYALKMKEMTEVWARLDVLERIVTQRAGRK
jgi:hypothetical protein